MGIAQRSKSNPKAFWSHCRRKLKTKCSVAPLLANIKDKDSLRFSDEEKANMLQKKFSSVFTKEPGDTIPTLTRSSIISELHVAEEMVRLHLSMINVNKSCGPDEVHPRMLFELADIIAETITFLFNLIFEHEILPKDLKLASVSPIFKKWARSVAENYRPISLTSILCKVMESFVRVSIFKLLMMNNLLSKKQYGFINVRSTTTQLLYYLDNCIPTIAEGGVNDNISILSTCSTLSLIVAYLVS